MNLRKDDQGIAVAVLLVAVVILVAGVVIVLGSGVVPGLCFVPVQRGSSVPGCGGLTVGFTWTANGLAITFSATVTGGVPPYTYFWSFGDGAAATVTVPGITHTYAASGTYTVRLNAYDSGSMSGIRVQYVSVGPNPPPPGQTPPVAGFTYAFSGLQVTVTGAASGGTPPYTYAWSWGDGTPNGVGVSVSHTYATNGYFTITLTVTDANANAGTASKQVYVTGSGSGGGSGGTLPVIPPASPILSTVIALAILAVAGLAALKMPLPLWGRVGVAVLGAILALLIVFGVIPV